MGWCQPILPVMSAVSQYTNLKTGLNKANLYFEALESLLICINQKRNDTGLGWIN
jgi:hypothetical protein